MTQSLGGGPFALNTGSIPSSLRAMSSMIRASVDTIRWLGTPRIAGTQIGSISGGAAFVDPTHRSPNRA
jgi:hypothetical protein